MSADPRPDKPCSRCGGRTEHSPVADAQCALKRALREQLVTAADALDRSPRPVEVLDLFAHLQTTYEEGTAAARAVQKVLDLGWRPVVGGGA